MIKDKAKFTKQDKNHDTIILMKIIIIFLNNCPQKIVEESLSPI